MSVKAPKTCLREVAKDYTGSNLIKSSKWRKSNQRFLASSSILTKTMKNISLLFDSYLVVLWKHLNIQYIFGNYLFSNLSQKNI